MRRDRYELFRINDLRWSETSRTGNLSLVRSIVAPCSENAQLRAGGVRIEERVLAVAFFAATPTYDLLLKEAEKLERAMRISSLCWRSSTLTRENDAEHAARPDRAFRRLSIRHWKSTQPVFELNHIGEIRLALNECP